MACHGQSWRGSSEIRAWKPAEFYLWRLVGALCRPRMVRRRTPWNVDRRPCRGADGASGAIVRCATPRQDGGEAVRAPSATDRTIHVRLGTVELATWTFRFGEG